MLPRACLLSLLLGAVSGTGNVQAAAEVVDELKARGERVGLVTVRLYRPFPTEAFLAGLVDEQVLSAEEIVKLQQLVLRVPVSDQVLGYAWALVRASLDSLSAPIFWPLPTMKATWRRSMPSSVTRARMRRIVRQ